MCLQYATCIARCRGVPHADREHLSIRVGHLFSAYHALGSLCAALHLSLTAGVAHPGAPLAETSAAALGPPPAPPPPTLLLADSPPRPAGSSSGCCSGGGGGGGGGGGNVLSAAGPEAMESEPAAEDSGSPGSLKLEEMDADDASSGNGSAADEATLPAPLLPGLPLALTAPAPAAEAAPVAQPAATPAVPPAAALAASPALEPQAEPAIGAALLPFGDAIDELISCVTDQAQLRAWHFALEYAEVRRGAGTRGGSTGGRVPQRAAHAPVCLPMQLHPPFTLRLPFTLQHLFA